MPLFKEIDLIRNAAITTYKIKTKKQCENFTLFLDDPYGIRTRVTAVKGRCLNRLTNGPKYYGSGGGDRTPDLTGMNRTL